MTEQDWDQVRQDLEAKVQVLVDRAKYLEEKADRLEKEMKRYKAHPVEVSPVEVVKATKMIQWNQELRGKVEQLERQISEYREYHLNDAARLTREILDYRAELTKLGRADLVEALIRKHDQKSH